MLGLFRWVTVASVLCLLTPVTLEAQYPRARRGQFEVRGHHDLFFTALPTGAP